VADFDDIDALLSSSLKKAAEPANSAGVADAIRSRVAGGDAGTTVAGSTAPGWGGGASGILTIVAPIALIVVAGVVGGALGVTGVFGAPLADAAGPRPYSATVDTSVAGLDCPGGAAVTDLFPGQRLFAIARTDDSDFVAVRDPAALDTTVWVDVDALQLEDDIDGLPVSGCGELVVETPTPTPTPEPTETQAPDDDDDTPTPPASDTSAPSIKAGNWSSPDVWGSTAAPYCTTFSDIVVSAADNVGVVSVTAATSKSGTTAALLSSGGGNYTFRFTSGPYGYPNPDVVVTVTFTAKDAAGNSANTARPLTLRNTCLI
jgi:hypothetical protein